MREIEETIRIPGYGRVYYVAEYSRAVGSDPIFDNQRIVHVYAPFVEDLKIVSATPLEGPLDGQELKLDPIVSKECLEHAENRILAGEGL
jgi:hypothetical protein